jgi:hypothetical protein
MHPTEVQFLHADLLRWYKLLYVWAIIFLSFRSPNHIKSWSDPVDIGDELFKQNSWTVVVNADLDPISPFATPLSGHFFP